MVTVRKVSHKICCPKNLAQIGHLTNCYFCIADLSNSQSGVHLLSYILTFLYSSPLYYTDPGYHYTNAGETQTPQPECNLIRGLSLTKFNAEPQRVEFIE